MHCHHQLWDLRVDRAARPINPRATFKVRPLPRSLWGSRSELFEFAPFLSVFGLRQPTWLQWVLWRETTSRPTQGTIPSVQPERWTLVFQIPSNNYQATQRMRILGNINIETLRFNRSHTLRRLSLFEYDNSPIIHSHLVTEVSHPSQRMRGDDLLRHARTHFPVPGIQGFCH